LEVAYFCPTPGRRNVIESFVAKGLKNHRAAADDLVRHLRILEVSRMATLREQKRLEHVDGEILSYRFKVKSSGNLWIRLLAAAWPTDAQLLILHPVIKKQNGLPRADIEQAKINLRIQIDRTKE
jgi:phage-related protein